MHACTHTHKQKDQLYRTVHRHHERIPVHANKIANKFDEHCTNYAKCERISLNSARMNSNLTTACWQLWQDANPELGKFTLTVQKQVYLQIMLYSVFLGGCVVGSRR